MKLKKKKTRNTLNLNIKHFFNESWFLRASCSYIRYLLDIYKLNATTSSIAPTVATRQAKILNQPHLAAQLRDQHSDNWPSQALPLKQLLSLRAFFLSVETQEITTCLYLVSCRPRSPSLNLVTKLWERSEAESDFDYKYVTLTHKHTHTKSIACTAATPALTLSQKSEPRFKRRLKSLQFSVFYFQFSVLPLI